MVPVLMLVVMFWSTAVSTQRPFSCESAGPADMVLLVDGSGSIGIINFHQVEVFLQGLVTPFPIGPDRVQIALTQYSDDPHTEWQLNDFTTKDQLLDAVRSFRYKGGGTNTGKALLHVLEENLKVESGARQNAPHFLVLLTDGQSQDDAIAAGNHLKKTGVEIIAVGVKDVDMAELRQVASEPPHMNLFYLDEFPLLSWAGARLAHILCGKMEKHSLAKNILFQPRLSLSSSMLGVSQDQQQGLQVFRDHSFTITCSIQPQYPGGSFHLTFTGSNTTLRHTLTAVNHSANFLFPAADHAHQGNYSCVYEVYVFYHNFTSESELLSLTVAANPLAAFIIRVVVVLLTLLTSNTALYLYFKTTRKPAERGSIELVSLHSSAEAGPGEERAAHRMEQEESAV
ncbi:collagen alpha-4(VI) chain-like [Osmerus mordax]|uniref:collagen alpha-4(VI) chain-like n=1 Tax=Osmerus mordax TaxID=8014 RepID=UPI00350F2489